MLKTPLSNKAILAVVLLCGGLLSAGAQEKKPATVPSASATVPSANGNTPTSPSRPGPKAFKDLITEKAVTRKGLFTVHKVDDKWYFEIPDSLLGRDVLVVGRISKSAADTRAGFLGFAGDEINENVIRFEKGPNNRIYMRNISYNTYAKDSTKPMYRAVMNSNIQPIAASFEIKALNKDTTGVVLDLTDYMNGDNDILFFQSGIKTALRLGALQSDKSYIMDVKSYPINTEIKTVKTYSKSSGPSLPGAPPIGPTGNATFELNTSVIILPKVPMHVRYFDERVAYFTTEYTDFDANPQGVKDISIITRWRLEPKDEDIEKFKRGELVEPKKPIIYYIDPATPKKWVPYLIQGVNDWQVAFEKAGFKNAIIAKMAPTSQEDSTWSLEDARNSAIVYKPSDIPNASGPHIHDPRSGEILESHINWYHNVMTLLRNWYLIQASPSDPRARKAKFDDELMGTLIRFVSSHEVGHTLGLPHNMGSSSAVPVEKLRDKAWVEANGHTPSIMDYARFNYVAQPDDHVSPMGLYPRIGDYDKWAIEWGYKPIYDKTEDDEKSTLNEWVKTRSSNSRLRFLDADGQDARAQTEDLGDNSVKASEYGLKNLKWILPQLPTWVNEKGEDYKNLSDIYGELVTQFQRYSFHVVMNIGGIYTDNKTTEQDGQVYTPVPKARQKEALNYLQKNVFETPTWLLNKSILDKITSPNSDRVSTLQDNVLASLLANTRLQRMISSNNRDANSYRIDEYFDDLKKGLWTELVTKKPIDNYRRNLQKSFVERLGTMVSTTPSPASGGFVITFGPPAPDPKKSDIPSVARGTLRALRTEIRAAIPTVTDRMSRYHLQDVADRIDHILDPK